MSGISDRTTDALAASLRMRLQRHNLTSSNIANAETPGYKAKKMDFEESLARAIDHVKLGTKPAAAHPELLALGSPNTIEGLRASVYDNPDINLSNDGNTVDLEKEMTSLSENSILYKAALQLINKKLGLMKYAASNGGR